MVLDYEKNNLEIIFDFHVNIHFSLIVNVYKWLKLTMKQTVQFVAVQENSPEDLKNVNCSYVNKRE